MRWYCFDIETAYLWQTELSEIKLVLHLIVYCPVSWGYRIHWLLFCGEVRPLPVKCPGYETIQSDGEVQVMLELREMWSTPSLPLLPGPLWPGLVAPDRVLSVGQIKLNCILMLNWIAWNRTVLTFKLHAYAKMNCFKWNCFCMLNWIVWNRTLFDIETVCKQKLYIY